MNMKLNVNGETYAVSCKPDAILLDVLRELGLKSVRRGCDTGTCGACTVLLDGKPILSCSYLAVRAQEHEITTVEGLGKEADIIIDHIINEGADQCGYCGPALTVTTYALKQEIANPTEEQVKQYLISNYCRCSGYEGQMRGIKKYLGLE